MYYFITHPVLKNKRQTASHLQVLLLAYTFVQQMAMACCSSFQISDDYMAVT